MEAEAALLRGFFAHALLSSRLRASGGGEDPDFSVGEDAVDVEENKFNFAGTNAGGCFRHRGDSSIPCLRCQRNGLIMA